MPPYPQPDPRGLSARPLSTVQGAFWIYVLVAALSLVSIVLVLTDGTFVRAIDEAGTGNDGIDVESLVSAVKVTTIVIAVIFLALYLFFAVKMRNGRNWARIVLTVLSALSVVSRFSVSSTVTVNGQEYSSNSNAISGWIGAIAALVAIVLMYLPASNAYFSPRRTDPCRPPLTRGTVDNSGGRSAEPVRVLAGRCGNDGGSVRAGWRPDVDHGVGRAVADVRGAGRRRRR